MNYQQAINAVVTPETNYFDRILTWSRWYITGARGEEITSESLRLRYESAYAGAIPAEPRVYGAVVKDLQKEKMIQHNGYTTAQNKKAHHRPINIWKVK